ncbi:MAG: lipopolysaccharide kinase InaA family protein [Candidatus Binatia bacterium]
MANRDWVWGPIPRQFETITTGNRVLLVVRSDVAEFVDSQTFVPGHPSQLMSSFQGREQLRSVNLKNGETALIRAYCHGGLFRNLTGKVFFTWPPRPFRELVITEEIRRRGIPTVEVYAACVAPLWGPFYRGWLLTRELKQAQDLWTAFQSGLVRVLGVEAVLAAVARTLKTLHRQGIYHRDLNVKNILVRAEPDGIKGYIIDFDKAKLLLGGLPAGLVRKNLNRLLRSICKLDPRRQLVSETHWNGFLSSYQAYEVGEA